MRLEFKMIGMRRTWGIAETIGYMYPGAQWLVRENNYELLEWYSEDIEKPTLEAIQAQQVILEAVEPMRVVREIRDWYLQQCDWTQATDLRALRGAEWCAAWDAYRQTLRDFPDSGIEPYFDEMSMIRGITWPTKPNLK